jgi:hypothetical protein
MNADMIGVTSASQDRFVLLVVPPEAPAAAASAMAMAADPTNSARPTDLLAASGIITEELRPDTSGRLPQKIPHAATRRS